MLQFLTSRKLLFVGVAILLLSWLIYLTAGNRTEQTSAERLLRTAVAPVERVFDTMADSARGIIHTVAELHRLTAENRRLAEEIDRVDMENQALRGYRLENERLRTALDLRQQVPYDLVAAEVIARSPDNWFSRLTIDRGEADGIRRDMGVIAAGGVVGRVYEARQHSADILLITDSMSQIGGMIERTGAHVLLRGDSSRPGSCQIIPLKDADFQRGDVVVTWEESEYFPRGLVIGTVVEAAKGQGGLPLGGRLLPAVKPGELDVMFVIRWVGDRD